MSFHYDFENSQWASRTTKLLQKCWLPRKEIFGSSFGSEDTQLATHVLLTLIFVEMTDLE